MSRQVASGEECLATVRTQVPPLPSVNVLVVSAASMAGEPLATHATAIGAIARV